MLGNRAPSPVQLFQVLHKQRAFPSISSTATSISYPTQHVWVDISYVSGFDLETAGRLRVPASCSHSFTLMLWRAPAAVTAKPPCGMMRAAASGLHRASLHRASKRERSLIVEPAARQRCSSTADSFRPDTPPKNTEADDELDFAEVGRVPSDVTLRTTMTNRYGNIIHRTIKRLRQQSKYRYGTNT